MACGGSRTNDPVVISQDNLNVALEEAVNYSIIIAVQNFKIESEAFKTTANNFCNNLSAVQLTLLQSAWRDLFAQWYRLANYNFGPLDDDVVFPKYTFIDSLRLRGTNYLETVRTEIANDLAGNHELNAAYFGSKTFQRVGLLALESVVFETAASEHSLAAADIIAEYQNNDRKCQILLGLAEQITLHADYIETGWLQSFKGGNHAYKTIFLTSQLEDGAEPITKLITSVQSYLDYLQNRNVVNTAAKISDHAWASISASIDEVETLLTGTDQTTISFFAIMEAAGFQTAVDAVKANIAEVRQSITQQDAAMLDIALGKLDGNFKREIPSGLAVELGINFSDGD